MVRKEKGHDTYSHGKGIKKTDRGQSKMTGAPNSNFDTRTKKNGKIIQRRKFGPDGKAYKDMDAGHKTHNKDDHVHDIKDGNRSKTSRPMSKKESKEFKKANRKRRQSYEQ